MTVAFQTGSNTQRHTFTGPLLLDVLSSASPRFDPRVKNDSLDGVSLADQGPRLVVPGDAKGERYVSNVVRIRLGRSRDPRKELVQ